LTVRGKRGGASVIYSGWGGGTSTFWSLPERKSWLQQTVRAKSPTRSSQTTGKGKGGTSVSGPGHRVKKNGIDERGEESVIQTVR